MLTLTSINIPYSSLVIIEILNIILMGGLGKVYPLIVGFDLMNLYQKILQIIRTILLVHYSHLLNVICILIHF